MPSLVSAPAICSVGSPIMKSKLQIPSANPGRCPRSFSVPASMRIALLAACLSLCSAFSLDAQTTASFAISDATVVEGNGPGMNNAVFTVTKTGVNTSPVTIKFATANGSALAAVDYQAQSSTLTFGPTDVTMTISVPIIGDTIDELNETFFVNLSKNNEEDSTTFTDSSGTGTITDDDGPPAISIDDVTQAEGNSGMTAFTFTVTLSNASSSTVTVEYATQDDTATAGMDYMQQNGTVTFAAGETSKTVTVQVTGERPLSRTRLSS